MKKYVLGVIAIIIAICLSSYTRITSTINFMLLTAPTSANIVNDNSQWADASAGGAIYGVCGDIPKDLACYISLTDLTMANYYHPVGSGYVLNSFSYADAQSPKKRYLLITEESSGTGSLRRISSIVPKKYDTGSSQWVTDLSVTFTSDYGFWNANLQEPLP
jgi:hypothetical protein